MLGHHWHASEMPLKWCFAGGPMMTRFVVVFGSPHQLKTEEKRLSKLVPSEKNFLDPRMYCVSRGILAVVTLMTWH